MRVEGWESKLIDYLRAVAREPFSWEHHNCFSFTMGAVEAMTGKNVATELLGNYDDVCSDKEGAQEFFNSKGYKSHVHFIAKHFTARPSVLLMCRGDVSVMRDLTGAVALGICQGDRVYTVTENGLATLPNENVRKAFAV